MTIVFAGVLAGFGAYVLGEPVLVGGLAGVAVVYLYAVASALASRTITRGGRRVGSPWPTSGRREHAPWA